MTKKIIFSASAAVIIYSVTYFFLPALPLFVSPFLLAVTIYLVANNIKARSGQNSEFTDTASMNDLRKNLFAEMITGIRYSQVERRLKYYWSLFVAGVVASVMATLIRHYYLAVADLWRYTYSFPKYHAKDMVPLPFLEIRDHADRTFQNLDLYPFVVILILTIIMTGLFLFVLVFLGEGLSPYIAGMVVVVAVVLFSTMTVSSSGRFMMLASEEPVGLKIQHDSNIYLKTLYLMKDKNYYDAYVEAAAATPALIADNAVRDGKFVKYVASPTFFRTPTVFYFWKFISLGKPSNLFYVNIIFVSLMLIMIGYIGRKMFGDAGTLLSLALVPYFVMGSIWSNIYMPDWWAGLAITAAIFLWILNKNLAAASLFLIAALFREVTIVFFLFFLVMTLVKNRKRSGPFLALLPVFIISYAMHYGIAAKYINNTVSTTESLISRLGVYDFPVYNFIPATSFLTFPYGFYLIPVYMLSIVGLIIWVRTRRPDLLAISIFALFYYQFASSAYWGQHISPFVIFSAFASLLFLSTKPTAFLFEPSEQKDPQEVDRSIDKNRKKRRQPIRKRLRKLKLTDIINRNLTIQRSDHA